MLRYQLAYASKINVLTTVSTAFKSLNGSVIFDNNFINIIQDSIGRTAIHVAIENKDGFITSFLLSHPAINLSIRDTAGRTPFTVAMANKDTNSAATILARDPTAADQVK